MNKSIIDRLSQLERHSNMIPALPNWLRAKALKGELTINDKQLLTEYPRTATRPAVTLSERLLNGSLR